MSTASNAENWISGLIAGHASRLVVVSGAAAASDISVWLLMCSRLSLFPADPEESIVLKSDDGANLPKEEANEHCKKSLELPPPPP
jgi:hypothetical protein